MLSSVRRLGLGSGMLVAVPIPQEAAAEGREVEAAIQQALREAEQQGIRGNEVRRHSCSCKLHKGRIIVSPARSAVERARRVPVIYETLSC